MSRVRRLILGTAVTTLVATGAAFFSAAPSWRSLPDGMAVVKLSFTHGGARDCRQLDADELARLPANMRKREICERERAALRLELDIDGEPVLRAELPPSGLAGDGPARVYRRFPLGAGKHEIAVRLADSWRAEGFDHAVARRITLTAEQNLVIDFRPERGGFVFN